MGFLRFILIFFLVIFALGLLSRILLGFFLRRLAKKMENRYSNQNNKDEFNKTTNNNEKKISKDTGEYIDFEEIKD